MSKDEFNYGNAFNIRRARAIEEAGGRDAIINPIVVAMIEAHGANLLSVFYMREQGGWTKMIEKVIGECPDAQANGIGMATNPAYFVWTYLRANVYDIRNLTIDALEAVAA